MHTTTKTKTATKIGSTNWLGGLSTSLASFLTVAQPQWTLKFTGRQSSKALHADRVISQSAHPFAMLVASDVSKRSCGLVP
jgi:hypothetical protein